MADYEVVETVLPNGAVMAVQIAGGHGARDVALGDRLQLGEVQEAITGLSQLVKDAISKVAPDKASVEFGMDLSVEAGKLTALLVSGSATASFKVALEWDNSTHADSSS